MKSILALTVITYKEGIRNRSVLGVLFFSLFVLGLNVAVSGFFMRDIGKVTVDMNLSALSFSGLLLVLFVGINLIAKDIDKKTIHLVLSKPISRIGYLWGKYLGILLFILVSLVVLLTFSVVTILGINTLYGSYFISFSWLVFFQAVGFIFVKLAVLSAIVMFFSSITTSSFVTLIFTICSYVVGETIEEVVFYINSGANSDAFSPALLGIIKASSYLLPNLAAFDFKIEAAHGLAIELSRIGYAAGYAVVYIFLLMLIASLIFQRREFN